ncbi:MAG: ATP-dependent DNA helicase RecG [Lachnospiraceae bacterium]|nr:ATP-dependent DNA helicase RecG [Lachnospiraceae bacterium]
MDIKEDIIKLKGIGEKTIKYYHRVGIFTYGDLMYYFPRDYIKYEQASKPVDDNIGTKVYVKGRIVSGPLKKRGKRMMFVTARIDSDGVLIDAVWFNMPYISNMLENGNEYVFGGTLLKKGLYFQLEHPAVFKTDDYDRLVNTLQPVYPLTKGLSNNALKKSITGVLKLDNDAVTVEGVPVGKALKDIHFPKSAEELHKARAVLVYDEFFVFILRLRLLKGLNQKIINDFNISESLKAYEIIDGLPYKLTAAQLKAFKDIEKDLMSKHLMSRLVQGDVGCGKTIVAFLAAITVVDSGYQCAIMVPTEILAQQHYSSLVSLFEEHKIEGDICLLTGSMTNKEKKEVYKKLENGECSVVIGTHALFQEKVKYRSLALVITDEQHRFGVKQRETLVQKGNACIPHVLVMSATPIPRTLAIIVYGDLDISVIDEVPAQRLPVKNCVVGIKFRQKAYEFIEKEVENGHQAYVICPLVEESEGMDCKDVVSYSKELKEIFSSGIRIEALHGQMKAEDKEKIMKEFSQGVINVLVSTTVVEVGVNVPNATVMMIENAERFGLAQLHQLRGRIGRGDSLSYCIFINGNENEKSKKRLEILNGSNDGFFIASQDLKLRGPGDMFGIRQSGEMEFRLGDIYTDSKILERASQNVKDLLINDPKLEKKENAYIRQRLSDLNNLSDIHAL